MDNNLSKKLSFWHIWALGVGAVVGDGIFVLIAQGAEAAGPSAIAAYAVAGLLMMIIMLVIVEMGVGMPSAGSLHTWSSRLLGPGYGTVSGLCYTAMNIIFLGSVSIANGALSNYFFQWTESPEVSAIIWAVLLVSIVCGVALLGGEITGRAQLGLVVILASIMIGFSVIGFISGKIDYSNYTPFMSNGFTGIWAAIGMGIYAYMGPLVLVTAGDEVKNITDLPKAMTWAFITFLVMYGLAMFVMLGLVHFTEFSSLESPYTYAASKIFGGAAGFIMNLAAWIAAFTCLVGELFASSRLLYGMAKEKVLPSAFSKINSRKVPYFGIIVSWIIAIVIIIIGNVKALETFYLELAMVGCELGVTCWIISLISSYKYKKDYYDEWKAIPWHVPARGLLLPLSFVGCGLVLYALFSSDPPSIIYSAVALGIIILFYNLYSKPNQTKSLNKNTD